MNIEEQQPVFETNYDAGYVGFISRRNDFVSAGINWFSRWADIPGDPPVSHTFIITGEHTTIEAFADGVKEGALGTYLADADVALLVRKPINYSSALGASIVANAECHAGEGYNYAIIAAMAVSNSLLGHAINQSHDDALAKWLTRLANSDSREICSQLVAKALEAQSELENHGCLVKPSYMITPQMLLSDTLVFEPGAIELLP